MPAEIQFDPDVFHGELTANRAQVFVRLPRSAEFADCTLHGHVHGPRCEFAHTLPAKYALTDLGAGPTLLARATITDPCLWTSDLPQIYDVHVELRRGSEVLAREQRMLGLRGIGARATGHLVRESKIWVPRGVAVELLNQDAGSVVDQLRAELLVGICSAPPLDLLVEASRRGVYLIANLSAGRNDFGGRSPIEVAAALRNLARWPAVMLVIIHHGETLDRGLQQVAPNLLLAQAIAPSATNFQPAAWATVAVADSECAQPSGTFPLLVQREQATPLTVHEARQQCDRLQRDLAARAQFAGYLIQNAKC